jgi:hypothetical protein
MQIAEGRRWLLLLSSVVLLVGCNADVDVFGPDAGVGSDLKTNGELGIIDDGVPYINAAEEGADGWRVNNARAGVGEGGVIRSGCLTDAAREWSQQMAASGSLSHASDWVQRIERHCGGAYTRLGENVGVGPDEPTVFNAFMGSPEHQANILYGDQQFIGVGDFVDGNGTRWVTQEFATCHGCGAPWTNAPYDPPPPAPPPPPPPPARPVVFLAFAEGPYNALYEKWWNGTWHGWVGLGGILTSAPAAVAWSYGRVDIVARGVNGDVIHKSWNGAWSDWESLGGAIVGAPTIASWGPNRLDVFARGPNNDLVHLSWDTDHWSQWESLGGVIADAPAATSWGPNRIDVVAQGFDHQLWHTFFQGQWYGWDALGGWMQGTPGIASWGTGRLDIVVEGYNRQAWHKSWQGGWSGWDALGGILTGGAAVASTGPGQLHVLVRGSDNAVWHKWWVGGWSDWEWLALSAQDVPTAATWH